YIVMELVTGGELFDRIVEKDHYNESEAANIFCQIMSALAYLHKNGIVHRDIKPENIIYQSREESSQGVRCMVYGVWCTVYGVWTLKTLCGTPSYLAPEVIDGSNRGYGKTCDIWSTGVILYILLCGCPPYPP
ncbi:kinase-like domain-containing protein, partial [Baffinella frigidus]